MTRQQRLKRAAVIFLMGFLAAVAFGIGNVSGDTLSLRPSGPERERVESGPQPDALQLKEPVITKFEGSGDERQLFLVARKSCLAAFQNTGFASMPLVSKTGGNGNWILLAGLSSSNAAGPGGVVPVLKAKPDGSAPADWYYTLDMYIIPSNRWSIRASLGFDSADIHDALTVSAQNLDPLHIGVAIAYDYGARNPLVLDLDYGRLPLDGHGAANHPIPEKLDRTPTGDTSSDTWVVSACLNIQF